MADRALLFSAPMVNALWDGRKTQTRRPLKPVPPAGFEEAHLGTDGVWRLSEAGHPYAGDVKVIEPRFAAGDRIWVRETWRATGCGGRADYLPPSKLQPHAVWYEADGPSPADQCVGKTRVSIHMPRWASRLTLPVTEVRVQRLQDITDEDALAEGVIWSDKWQGFVVPGVEHPAKDFPVLSRATAREMYAALWDTINGSGEWLGNPWVTATSFSVERRNIDQ